MYDHNLEMLKYSHENKEFIYDVNEDGSKIYKLIVDNINDENIQYRMLGVFYTGSLKDERNSSKLPYFKISIHTFLSLGCHLFPTFYEALEFAMSIYCFNDFADYRTLGKKEESI